MAVPLGQALLSLLSGAAQWPSVQVCGCILQLPSEKSVQGKQAQSGKNSISESLFSLTEEGNFADRFSFGSFFFFFLQ